MINIIRGRMPRDYEKEYKEWWNFDSVQADSQAAQAPGNEKEPWLNVLHTHEPESLPGFEVIQNTPDFRERLYGNVMDIGAGTCLLSAKCLLLPEVKTVYSVDLSEKFFVTTDLRVMNHFHAELQKINFVVSDFNELPLDSDSIDCILFFASLHYSLSPIKTLMEAGRCLRKGGSMVIYERPSFGIRIRQERNKGLFLSQQGTEMRYTLEEWLCFMRSMANVGTVTAYPLDILSRQGFRLLIRRMLRKICLEHVLINLPFYLFIIEKDQGTHEESL